jgi:endonuclease G
MPTHEKRTNLIPWIVLLLFLVCIITLTVLIYRGCQSRSPARHPEPTQPAVGHPPPTFAGSYAYAGTPTTPDSILVLTNTGYLVGYSDSRHDPLWVCYRLFKTPTLQAPPRPSGFSPDPRTHSRVTQATYTGSGYDRGHLAPNYAIALCYGVQAQKETFLMSNIIPQDPDLNRQVWEHLEETEIRDYAQRFGQVWVVAGPVFTTSNTLGSGVDIPTACYKILVRESDGAPQMLAFIIPQTVTGNESPAEFLSSVDEVEKETGLDFFADLPDNLENRLESGTPSRVW